MATTPRKIDRHIAMLRRPTATAPALIQITQDGAIELYHARPLPIDSGLLYRLAKLGTDRTYELHLDDAEGDSCTCPGHTYKGRCKHVSGFRALAQHGLLPALPIARYRVADVA